LFDSNKQIQAAGYLGANHVELQLSNNPFNHFAIAGNIDFGAGIANYDLATGVYGYNKSGQWRYELLGGYGYNNNSDYNGGNILSKSEQVSYDVSSLYHKVYIRPAIGFCSNIRMYRISYSFSLSADVSWVYFKDYLFRETDEKLSTPAMPVYIVNKDYNNKSAFLLEPCITNKVGIKNIYAILQLQAIIPYSQQIDVRNTKFSPVIAYSLGLQYNFKFRSKK